MAWLRGSAGAESHAGLKRREEQYLRVLYMREREELLKSAPLAKAKELPAQKKKRRTIAHSKGCSAGKHDCPTVVPITQQSSNLTRAGLVPLKSTFRRGSIVRRAQHISKHPKKEFLWVLHGPTGTKEQLNGPEPLKRL